MSASDWTRNADGTFVRWNRPPHYVNGVLCLVLDHEDAWRLDDDEHRKRIHEYYLLTWRDMGMTGPPRSR